MNPLVWTAISAIDVNSWNSIDRQMHVNVYTYRKDNYFLALSPKRSWDRQSLNMHT